MTYDEICQKLVGKNKVQALKIEEKKGGVWKLQYKEGKKIDYVECENRETLDQILIAFGGKNLETCRAPDKFLSLCSSWGSEDLNEIGHTITKIAISGKRSVRSLSNKICVPGDCGTPPTPHAKRTNLKTEMTFNISDTETISQKTFCFNKRSEFDNLVDFIFNHKSLKNLSYYTNKLCTENRETKDQCVWERCLAGDGSKRMVLELKLINGKKYEGMVRADVFRAAGDMFETPCQRLSFGPKKGHTQLICGFAIDDGKIDANNYKLSSEGQ